MATPYSSALRSGDLGRMNLNCTAGGSAGTDRTASEFPAKSVGNPWQSCQSPAPVILELMLSEKLREHGVVGAGGAGFPTYVKAQSQVEFMIANGAECEPLLHKDAELMKHFPGEILAGMTAMMDATGARQGKFGIKTKNAESLEALKHSLKDVGRARARLAGTAAGRTKGDRHA